MNQAAALNWRKQVLIYSMMIMLAGLLFSRIILSASMIIFIFASLLHRDLSQQLKEFFSSPVFWSITILFLMPLLSGIWSEDLAQWSRIMRIKLPLLLLPFCFAGLKTIDSRDWQKIAWVFLFLVFVGSCWSLAHYIQDTKSVHSGYLQSHAIVTPMKNDHVRFSLLVAVAIITSIFLLVQNSTRAQIAKIAAGVLILFFIVYLHILAVRTGLLCFYLSMFIFVGWLIWNKKHPARTIALLFAIIALPVVSYFLFPTLQNRLRYFNYDISFARKNIYLPGSNDGTRILSLKAAWDIQQQHPVTGVGFGDVEKEMNTWYGQHYPQMLDSDKILPSSEWLTHGAAVGWPGFLLFTLILFVPFFAAPVRRNIFWWMTNLSIILTYVFDNGLEGQFSIFVHVFLVLWWYRWLTSAKP